MLDVKKPSDGEDDDEDDDEDDEGYWIDGPDGDEIRSKWRKKPLLVLAVESLLHPRATNLPPDVQCSFVHAAMKMFIKSADPRCDKGHTAQIIALMRVRLPVFLQVGQFARNAVLNRNRYIHRFRQSVHLEVQERASALRYLLAELNILRIETTDDDEVAEVITEDLLSFPTTSDDDASSTTTNIEMLPVDVSGAERAHGGAFALLHAIVAEPFYSVHPKAQRKVPVPEDLKLDEPFNKKVVSELELLACDRKASEEFSMSAVSFIGKMGGGGSNQAPTSGRGANGASEFAGDSDDDSPYTFPTRQEATPNSAVPDKTFYLQHVDAVDEPLAHVEGGSDEEGPFGASAPTEIRKKKSKKGSSKKSKDPSKRSKSSRKEASIDRQEMQPVGAAENWSSDDEAGVFRNVAGVKKGMFEEGDAEEDQVGI